jgi:spermidine synthase
MAGIALGNGIAARYAARIARPVVAYALLELVIAISGVGLVWALPSMTDTLTAILRPIFDQPWVLNPVRLGVSFLVLLVPATAMGATLPLVVRALHSRDSSFGSVLGRLYGINTLGAMVGAVVGEAFLIEWLGIRGTAIFVAGLGLAAALGALLLARGFPPLAAEREIGAHHPRLSQSAWLYLVSAFLSGGILLALEVVWFRFIYLFAHGGELAFSLMLATVLMGIGLGGFAGGMWVRWDPIATKPSGNLIRNANSRWLAVAAFLGTMLFFPSGLMQRNYLQSPVKRYHGEVEQIALTREGVLQTLIYLRNELDGELVHHRLLTDAYSMSSTSERSRRYMRLFAYWPLAVHSEAKSALLISFGVGETAKALTETRSLEQIDIVDTSRDILDSSSVLFPDPKENPLNDPRVRVYVEDGRYFLRTTQKGYDLITGEPPPPKMAGVISLYTREYFQLVYDRLNEGGVNTYWLPVHNLTEEDSKAIIRGYCDVFADCALWSGTHLDWMLTGSKNRSTAPSEEAFTRQWRDPIVGERLRRIGIDDPTLLGTLFMAGPTRLREITSDTAPLIDDFPKRVGNELPSASIAKDYASWMDPSLAQRRFQESVYIRTIWPPRLRERTLDHFTYQRMLLDSFGPLGVPNLIVDLHRVLSETQYRFLALHLMGQNDDVIDAVRRLVARGGPKDRYRVELAADALADRDFASAAQHIVRLGPQPQNDRLFFIHVYALCMSGDLDGAEILAANGRARFGRSAEGRELRSWFQQTFGLEF